VAPIGVAQLAAVPPIGVVQSEVVQQFEVAPPIVAVRSFAAEPL
jgi:hypothetical protein